MKRFGLTQMPSKLFDTINLDRPYLWRSICLDESEIGWGESWGVFYQEVANGKIWQIPSRSSQSSNSISLFSALLLIQVTYLIRFSDFEKNTFSNRNRQSVTQREKANLATRHNRCCCSWICQILCSMAL